MKLDLDKVEALLREAAETEVMPRFRRLEKHEVSEKKPGDLVTAADLGVERFLSGCLPDLVAGSKVVGEEGVHADPTILARIAEEAPVWIVDPIDGTANFADGKALFAIQLAYVERGTTCAAWIFDPAGQRIAVAERGAGAWIDGQRAPVPSSMGFGDMHGAVYAGPTRPGIHPDFKARVERYGDARYRRCVGQEYLDLAAGRIQFALFTRLLPWDHAAGAHIHEEAGGYLRLTDGRAYRPTVSEGYLLLTPNADIWDEARAYFLA